MRGLYVCYILGFAFVVVCGGFWWLLWLLVPVVFGFWLLSLSTPRDFGLWPIWLKTWGAPKWKSGSGRAAYSIRSVILPLLSFSHSDDASISPISSRSVESHESD